jgi:uncharacterized membrane protein
MAMAKATVGVFDTTEQAHDAVQELFDRGVPHRDISVIAPDRRADRANAVGEKETMAGEGAEAGAVSGGLLGGALGALVGIGALAIPGVGPIIAAGPLMAALGSAGAGAVVGAGVGAASGGILGALIGAGIPEEEAHVYAESVRRGSTLVTVTTSAIPQQMVTDVLTRNGAVDLNARSESWRTNGWTHFDPERALDDRDLSYADRERPVMMAAPVATPYGTTTGTGAGLGGAIIYNRPDTTGTRYEESREEPVPSTYRRQAEIIDSELAGRRGQINPETTPAALRSQDERLDQAEAAHVDDETGEVHEHHHSKVGTATGIVAGATTGAIIGSAGGPIGTLIGGVAGMAVGAITGAVGDTIGERASETDEEAAERALEEQRIAEERRQMKDTTLR